MAGRGNAVDRASPQDQASSENGLDPSKGDEDQGVRSVLPGPKKKAQRAEPNSMALAGAGLEIGLAVAGLTLVGWWLDGRWGTRPWLMLAGLAVAIVGGTYNVWKIGRSFFDD